MKHSEGYKRESMIMKICTFFTHLLRYGSFFYSEHDAILPLDSYYSRASSHGFHRIFNLQQVSVRTEDGNGTIVRHCYSGSITILSFLICRYCYCLWIRRYSIFFDVSLQALSAILTMHLRWGIFQSMAVPLQTRSVSMSFAVIRSIEKNTHSN